MASVPPGLGLITSFLNLLVTRPGLHQKFNEATVYFFRKCLSLIMVRRLASGGLLKTGLTDSFSQVLIIDSSSWSIPEELQWIFPGSGGSASKAACKLQFCYDYSTGEAQILDEMKGTLPDQKYTQNLAALAKEAGIFIFDLGYWSFQTFFDIAEKGAYFLSRLNTQVKLYKKVEDKFIVVNLREILKKSCQHTVEIAL